jgi:hypothetical protein
MLSLHEIRTLTGLADVLYTFLPGSGNTAWKAHTTFRAHSGEGRSRRLLERREQEARDW